MQVINGVPSLPSDPIGEEKFRDHVQRKFAKSSLREDALWEIVKSAASQKHGTMIVVPILSAADGYALSGGNHFTLSTDQTSTSKASA
jgi:hypothetical protein